jgi:hypothetical protein
MYMELGTILLHEIRHNFLYVMWAGFFRGRPLE